VGASGAWLPSQAAAAVSPFVAYTADSAFRTRVTAAGVSSAATASFRSFMASHVDQRSTLYPVINGLGTNKWGTAYAMASATDPVWKLTGNVSTSAGVLKTQGFHAPDWLVKQFTGTSDTPFCVIDRGFGITVFGTNAVANLSARTIDVGSGGVTYHSSNGLDRRNPKSNDTRNFTSRGRISDAMVIRRDLVDAGIANGTGLGHVLHMFLCETKSSDGFCHPMVGAEGSKYGWGAEGQRVAIAPSVNLTTRGLSPAGLVVARTLQEHGAYIGDNSGSGSTLKAEQSSSTRDVWQGLLTQTSLKGITWNDFVALPKGW
jgi:hypothetical protein